MHLLSTGDPFSPLDSIFKISKFHFIFIDRWIIIGTVKMKEEKIYYSQKWFREPDFTVGFMLLR